MASNLRVDQILPSTSTNVAIGTATGSITLVGSVSGTSITNSGVTTVAAGSASAPSITPTGDSNTGIFFPSADTIAFAEGGVEALRIDSSANIGIGTNSPGAGIKLDVVGGEIKAGRVDSSQEGGQVSFGRATDNATAWYLDVYGNTSTPQLRFVDVSNAAVRASIDSSGNFTLNSGNIVIGTAGKGIDFSATSNSSGTMTSELLSDYEEGTWTPYWSNVSGADVFSGNAITVFNARYQKVGSWVHASAYFYSGPSFSYSSGNGSGTALYIAGLPFTTNNFYAGSVGYFTNWSGWSAGYTPMLITESSSTLIRMNYANANGVAQISAGNLSSAGGSIIFNISYRTNS
jgi:hypothetical protein